MAMTMTKTKPTRSDVVADLQRARRWILFAEVAAAILAAASVAVAAASCHL